MTASFDSESTRRSPRRAVYGTGVGGVNRARRTQRSPAMRIVTAVGAALLLSTNGCRSARPDGSAGVVVALWCDPAAETLARDRDDSTCARAMDLERAAALGFNAIAVPAERGEQTAIVGAARRAGLAPLAAERDGEARLVRAPTDDGAEGRLRLVTVDAAEPTGRPIGSPQERLISQYHAGLCRGLTDGLMLRAACSDFDDDPGVDAVANVDAADDDGSRQRRSAVRSLIDRVRRWSPRLTRSEVRRAENIELDPPYLRAVLFGERSRRHLLVFNRSDVRYARGRVRIHGAMDGRAVDRAVQVPAESDRLPGSVHDAQGARLTIPIELRPGGAALFELF